MITLVRPVARRHLMGHPQLRTGVAALIGKKKVGEATPPMPTSAVENVKADVAEIKESARR